MLEAFGHCISTFFLDYQYQDRTNILSMSYQHPTCLCWQIYCVPRSRRFCSVRTRYCSPRTPAAQEKARGEFSEASYRLLLRSVLNLHPAICQRSALRRAVKRRLRVYVGCEWCWPGRRSCKSTAPSWIATNGIQRRSRNVGRISGNPKIFLHCTSNQGRAPCESEMLY